MIKNRVDAELELLSNIQDRITTLAKMNNKSFDLTHQLEGFAASIILVYDQKPISYPGDYLAKQLIRFSCLSALNYGEVLGSGYRKR
ncbi:MAG: hypothetical protein L0J45_04175 [Psychroflexus sp.]|nr:hypothetical protein [Psychroflexus sp.]MDN6309622.1 hypothetical protein [Psychroflexus sp.]